MSDDTRPTDLPGQVGDGEARQIEHGDAFGEWSDLATVDSEVVEGEPAADDSITLEPGAVGAAASPSLARRAVSRVFRRPVAWWQRPWSTERIVRVLVTSTVLVTTTVVMMMVVHLNPLSPSRDLIFDDTTPTGGDMGAHVWAPAFLRDHFLTNFQLSGWTMDWYGGLPLYRFYMVIPALAIVALDVVLPYGVAFKLVAVVGVAAVPARVLGVRSPRELPSPDPRAVLARSAVLPARRELLDLRRQREVDDGGRVLVLDRTHAGRCWAWACSRTVCAPAGSECGPRWCCRWPPSRTASC